ncbi:MAG: MBL fold metallo-hydrolase [Flavobacteriales bacterium]|jgi:hydroxyacylglutathione hydrolase|nr:MBL fold metallo-hydrolase [Flavobacteriales bacterium]
MEIKKITFNPFQENTYVVWDETRECIIIDPGCYEDSEKEILKRFIVDNNLNPVKLINTHCHIDHILGNRFVSENWNIELHIHKLDLPLLENAGGIAKTYGFKKYEGSPYPQHFLKDGDLLNFGKSKLEIVFTPGHAPGHICLFSKEEKFIVAGDVLFNGSIGRTDLPGGDYDTLIDIIQNKLMVLEDETVVHCGHGPSTTIGKERMTNPFLYS